MKKFGVFTALFGVAYFIFKIWEYISDGKGLMTLLFGLLLAICLIEMGLDMVFSINQKYPRLHKYFTIVFSAAVVIFFIWAIVMRYNTGS